MSDDTLTAEFQALTYRDGGAPRPANKWRGPFPNEAVMQRAIRAELGDSTAETRTIVRPGFLDSR
jgi:hypothetical protein